LNKERNSVLAKSFVSSLISKFVSFGYQIASIPMLISMIGANNFGLLSMLMSVIGWVNILSSGISPYVTKTLSENSSTFESQKVIACSRTLLLIGSLFLTFIFVISCIYLYLYFPVIVLPSFILFLLSILILNFSVADSIRQGIKQQHINNLWMTVTNIIIILCIGLASFMQLDDFWLLPLAVSIIYAPLLITKLLNFYTIDKLFFKQGYFIGIKDNKPLYKAILSMMVSNLLIQLSVVMIKTFAIIYLVVGDPIDAAKMEVVFRYLLISGTLFATIQLPLWPLITEAKAKGDLIWLKMIKKYLGVGFFFYGLINFLVMFYFGGAIFELWVGATLSFDINEIYLAAGYFLSLSLVQSPIIILMGFGEFRKIGKVLFMESSLFFVLILIITTLDYEFGLGQILFSMIILRLLAFSQLFKFAYK
jgi:O-antigen/teichoic acid export membrane protein